MEEPPAQVRALLNLLADPAVQKWLEKQGLAQAATPPAFAVSTESVSDYFSSRVGAIREHMIALFAALLDLPYQFKKAIGHLQAEIPTRGTVPLLVLAFAVLGFGVEWLFRKATQHTAATSTGFLWRPPTTACGSAPPALLWP